MDYSNYINLMLIEDEDFDVKRVKNTLNLFEESFYLKKMFSNGSDAIEELKENHEEYDIIIMDFQIAGAIKGEDLIRRIKLINPTLQIIVITKLTINITDFNFAKGLLDAGAYWYCTKYPGDIENYIYQPTDFLMSLFNAYEKKKLEMMSYFSNKKLQNNVEKLLEQKSIIGESKPMEELKKKIEKLAASDMSILIAGDSGTGKELVANNIHYKSKRRFENFVPINCGSIPNDLVESELFGYEKGAFTGAANGKEGLFEIANGGTLFLDEISELPQSAQVKLLRVIQEGEIEKIGRTKSVKVDVRIIAATNKSLEQAVRDKQFREDLYYRLNVVPVIIPSLKERGKDIEILLQHFLQKYSLDMGKPVPKIDNEVVERMKQHNWPGNVRELKNVVQRLIFNADDRITLEHYETSMVGFSMFHEKSENVFNFQRLEEPQPLKELEKNFRKEYVNFIRENSASDAEAASKLGLAPSNYHRLCKDLGLK
jgi:DNA-binding NtrC family response regulator